MRFTLIDTAGLDQVWDDGHLPTASIAKRPRREHDSANFAHGLPLSVELQSAILEQTKTMVQSADVVLFLIDARAGAASLAAASRPSAGITPMDEHFARWLRKAFGRSQKRIIVVANKCELSAMERPDSAVSANALEACGLGFGDATPLSAEHGDGLADLFVVLRKELEKARDEANQLNPTASDGPSMDVESVEPVAAASSGSLHLAVVGRPNVGKSSLVNALIGDQRVVVGSQPGTTRDSIRVIYEYKDKEGQQQQFSIVDTVDSLAMRSSLEALNKCTVAMLVLDATLGRIDVDVPAAVHSTIRRGESESGGISSTERNRLLATLAHDVISHDDIAVAVRAVKEGRALFAIANKWDLVPPERRDALMEALKAKLASVVPEVGSVPIIAVSALTNLNVARVVPAALDMHARWDNRVPTARLNAWLEELLRIRPPPRLLGRPIKLRYITQVKARPPTFFLPCARSVELPEAYTRFLAAALRREFKLEGVPVRVHVRQTPDNPYTSKLDAFKARIRRGKAPLGNKYTK